MDYIEPYRLLDDCSFTSLLGKRKCNSGNIKKNMNKSLTRKAFPKCIEVYDFSNDYVQRKKCT